MMKHEEVAYILPVFTQTQKRENAFSSLTNMKKQLLLAVVPKVESKKKKHSARFCLGGRRRHEWSGALEIYFWHAPAGSGCVTTRLLAEGFVLISRCVVGAWTTVDGGKWKPSKSWLIVTPSNGTSALYMTPELLRARQDFMGWHLSN